MAKRDQLRTLRVGTIINVRSKKQESETDRALRVVEQELVARYQVRLVRAREWLLKDIVGSLRSFFPNEEFHYFGEKSSIRPDGGVLSVVATSGEKYPITHSRGQESGYE